MTKCYVYILFFSWDITMLSKEPSAEATAVSLKAVGWVFLCYENRAEKMYSQGFLAWRKRSNPSVNPILLLLVIRRSPGKIWFFLHKSLPWHFLFFPLGVGWQVPLRQNNSQGLLPKHLANSIWTFHVLSVNILHFKFPLPFKAWFVLKISYLNPCRQDIYFSNEKKRHLH